MDLSEFVGEFRKRPAAAGFVLDFDGTLSSVVATPIQARPVEGARRVLESLAGSYRLVALVSGRRAEDVKRIVGATGVSYVGLYGAERIEDGEPIQPPEAEGWRGMASRLARDAQALIVSEGLEGAEVEYKDLAVSVHFRNASDPRAADAIQQWAITVAPKRGFEAGVGRMVVEMRPVGVSKASALGGLVQGMDLELVVVAGDDYQDVDAMKRAGEILGDRALRIGVASDEEPAGLREVCDLVVSSPIEVLDLLRRFVM